MNQETKSCQNCQKDFTIEPEDFNFYGKIKVPSPSWCPECRIVRRFAIHNTWSLFWRNCEKCGIKTLSTFEPETKITTYCQPCWWGDSWDGTEYAMDYDPSRPFLEQLKELSNKTPYAALETAYLTLKNSDYSNDIAWSKDCYLVFWADYCDTVFYSSLLNGLKYSADCIRGYESELCYESIGFTKNYRTFFSDECDTCVDVWFSRNCYGCTNCIGCVNLRGASNYIFNVKYSKEEYAEKLKELSLDSWSKLRELEKRAHEFWLTLPYREYDGHSLNLNVTGEHVYTSKNSKEVYVVNGAENCKWTQFITVPTAKDCMDYSGWGNNSSLIYESATVGENANSIYFCYGCWPDSLNLQYCSWNISGKNNFGCFNLKRKQYCILNKQYSKEEYEKLKNEIIADMKINPYIDKLGRKYYYGEFFPSELSKFSYNKSNAIRFFPKTKEQATREGFNWSDRENIVYNISKPANSLPEKIANTGEDILNEVIECENCGNGYRVVQGEYDLLRKMNLPIPHECPKCREIKRFARMNKPKLHHRNCMKCGVNIYTPYSPESPNIVYCVKCYQQEFA
ncbi:MAG: hypothetical protein PHT16_01030 [Candidatus Pacebacteria bacterium]|nr:hypothetical protein [Candidatus Paceibacterota bacterium]